MVSYKIPHGFRETMNFEMSKFIFIYLIFLKGQKNRSRLSKLIRSNPILFEEINYRSMLMVS